MLLNATHEITFSGLPPDILDAYVRYKKGTRAIVCWLVQYAPSRYHGVKKLPLRHLADLAASVSGRLPAVPEMIHFYFRETIAARKRLSAHFKRQLQGVPLDDDTINHEHFTTNLAEIYENLCRCCGQTRDQCRKQERSSTDSCTATLSVNQFDSLALVTTETDHDRKPDNIEMCEAVENPGTTAKPMPEVSLEDDNLTRDLEIACIFQQIQQLVESVDLCWKGIARGQAPFYLGAFYNNVVDRRLQRLGSQLEELGFAGSSKASGRISVCSRDVDIPQHDSGCLQDTLRTKIDETQLLWNETCRHCSNANANPCIVQRPADYISSHVDHEENASNRLNKAMMVNFFQLMSESNPHPDLVRIGVPTVGRFGVGQASIDESSTTLSDILTIHILNSSFSTYLNHLSDPQTASQCRLTNLKLAREASCQISTILADKSSFPCQCPQTLAWHLQNLQNDLETFTQHRCWNLLFQSPWVAGNHILEMLDLCQYYGSKLLKYRHYIGSVCHSYNALVQLAGLEQIPLLEAFCHEFGGVLFPGGHRPQKNFRAPWSRFVGARLKFKQGHRHRSHRDNWCMTIPAHAAKAAAGLGVCDEKNEVVVSCGRGDVLFEIKRRGWNVSMSASELDKLRQVASMLSPSRPSSTSAGYKASQDEERRPSREGFPTIINSDPNDIRNLYRALFSTSTNSPSQNESRRNTPALNKNQEKSTCTDPSAFKHQDKSFSGCCVQEDQNHSHFNAPTHSLTDPHTHPHHYPQIPNLPSPLTNLFKVFADSVAITSQISNTLHPFPPSTPPAKRTGESCICFTTTILAGADRILESRRFSNFKDAETIEEMGWKRGEERACVDATVKALRDVLGQNPRNEGKVVDGDKVMGRELGVATQTGKGNGKGMERWMYESLL